MSHDTFTVDELDLRIVHALQISPRAPWSQVASVAAADRATVMRRWQRMAEAGAAWITCYPPRIAELAFAVVQLRCEHGQALQVAAQLAADPHAVTISAYTGGWDLGMEVFTRDQRDQSRYLLGRLAAVGGIRDVRIHQAVAHYRHGGQWRVGALDAAAERGLVGAPATTAGPTFYRSPGSAISEAQREIADALAADPRMPVSALAARLGVSRATAHRRLAELLSVMRMRCELAQSLTQWPVCATFFVRCPADKVDVTGQALSKLREIRAVMATVGRSNLCFSAWLPSVTHVYQLESQLAARMPHAQVVERDLVIRPVKLMGHLLDEDGLRTGTVPIDVRRNPLELA